MTIRILIPLLITLSFALPAFAQDDLLTIVSHDSFAVSSAVIEQFTEETGIRVEILRVGDAGLLVNQAILSANNPLGDVLFGVDNTFLSRALNADIFIPYESPYLALVDQALLLDREHRVTPIDFADVCLNYDVQFFEQSDTPVPTSLQQLTLPEYRDMLVVQNPATSSPGLAFLLTTIAVFGDTDDPDGYMYLDYWRELVENGVYVTDGWTDAYYGQFSGSAGSMGERPLVVSYATSPAAEVYFSEDPDLPAPTGSVIEEKTCFRQIEFAGILNGTDNLPAAQQWIDFMLDTAFQADMPLNMFVYPINPDVELPEVFTRFAAVPEAPITMDASEIDANRDRWIREWTETVLR